MSLVRIAIERLLLALFWIARSGFLAGALGTATAVLATPALGGGAAAPPWLEIIARSCWLLAGISLAAVALLFAAPGLRAPRGRRWRRTTSGPLPLTLAWNPNLSWRSGAGTAVVAIVNDAVQIPLSAEPGLPGCAATVSRWTSAR